MNTVTTTSRLQTLIASRLAMRPTHLDIQRSGGDPVKVGWLVGPSCWPSGLSWYHCVFGDDMEILLGDDPKNWDISSHNLEWHIVVHVYVYVYIHVYIYIHVCVYIYILYNYALGMIIIQQNTKTSSRNSRTQQSPRTQSRCTPSSCAEHVECREPRVARPLPLPTTGRFHQEDGKTMGNPVPCGLCDAVFSCEGMIYVKERFMWRNDATKLGNLKNCWISNKTSQTDVKKRHLNAGDKGLRLQDLASISSKRDEHQAIVSTWKKCVSLFWLVIWTPLKNMKVNWDDYSQYMGK